MINGEYFPVKYGIEKYGDINKAKNATWMGRDGDYKIAGIQLNCHGDRGSNGSKGNIKNMEMSYGNCVTAHSHSAQILRNAWCVGTSTHLKLPYNEGSASSWTQSSCLIYGNGQRQLIHVINGNWQLK